MTLVIDASVTLAWALEDKPNDYADRIFSRLPAEPAVVPNIWALEVANGLLVAERRHRVTAAESSQVRAILQDLPINADPFSLDVAPGSVLIVARTHQLTAYDAAYLELALREGLPLATVDGPLRTAATRAGVPLAD